jgi:hypothetical protein
MSQLVSAPGQQLKAQELQRAFDAFNQVSQALTQAYQGLQGRVESLTAELALANGQLRRQYEEKEALSERLSLLLNALPAGVVVLDSAGSVGEANPAARQMFGQAVIGEAWSALVRARLVATEAPGEWCLESRRLAIVESPLDSAGGRILLIHDVTAAHGLKVEVERNQRLVAMGEMAASLAHQLRTPLATALLYSANLGQAQLTDAARVRFADKTTAQLKRLERLIQEVLLFARGESLGRDTISCRATACRRCGDRPTPVFGEGSRFSRHLQRWRRVPHWQPEGPRRRAGESARECLAGLCGGWQGDPRRRSLRSTAANWCPRYRFRDLPRGPGTRFRTVLYDARARHRPRFGDRPRRGACARGYHQCKFASGGRVRVRDPVTRQSGGMARKLRKDGSDGTRIADFGGGRRLRLA